MSLHHLPRLIFNQFDLNLVEFFEKAQGLTFPEKALPVPFELDIAAIFHFSKGIFLGHFYSVVVIDLCAEKRANAAELFGIVSDKILVPNE